MTQSMTRPAIGAALAATALALAACASNPAALVPAGSPETPKPIAVSLVKLNHDIAFEDGGLAPGARQAADLETFLTSSGDTGRDHVYVLASATSLDGERADALVARLGAKGVSASAIRDSSLPAGVLRVTIERYVASAPDCPDWSRVAWANFNNLTSSNFGCATSADLAAMVADPHDLIGGRTMGPVVGDPATFPIERYRIGAISLRPAGAGASGSGDSGGGGGGGGGGFGGGGGGGLSGGAPTGGGTGP
jgi:pilus assembly protein CpaD